MFRVSNIYVYTYSYSIIIGLVTRQSVNNIMLSLVRVKRYEVIDEYPDT